MMERRKRFYVLLLFLLHVVADVFELFCDKLVHLRRQFNIFVANYIQKTDLRTETRRLSKLPRHLTVLLGKEEPSLRDLTNFILWAVAAGIPYISFYDHRGLLKKHIVDFKDEANKRKGNVHILWHNEVGTGYQNGFSGRKIHVKLLSPSDGRSRIAESCRDLARSEKPASIDIKRVEATLKKSFEFPDPDLGIYFGNNFRLYDYPPWQIAVTEFVNITTHRNCHQMQFLELLRRYSKCEQRLGK